MSDKQTTFSLVKEEKDNKETKKFKYPKREGTLNIPVGIPIDIKICQEGKSNYGKQQFSGFAKKEESDKWEKYLWFPTQQLLNAGLKAIKSIRIFQDKETKWIVDPVVKIKRLNEGGINQEPGHQKIGYEFTFRVTEDMFEE